MSGVIFDLTGSYQVAFANGLMWNLVNVLIALLAAHAAGPAGRARLRERAIACLRPRRASPLTGSSPAGSGRVASARREAPKTRMLL